MVGFSMSYTKIENYFTADRPFFYAIVSGRDNTVTNQLFSGRYMG